MYGKLAKKYQNVAYECRLSSMLVFSFGYSEFGKVGRFLKAQQAMAKQARYLRFLLEEWKEISR
jgi:hypothetical protein